ncbi:related to S.pombe Rnp24p, Nsr1p and human splicing factor [Rhynchosporium agropyri]|uniref:Related to S.pombe Rnp24p, Nsr1p and human splicing factor n=1 Tax=Rhynchosporium agropyri TaxID=914238 RepID=A0A1E1L3Q5_9HELO|nr:related to S.pombe Rnp24p, Nsr1p and human splicing factor [Rhynchosporium agropyri]
MPSSDKVSTKVEKVHKPKKEKSSKKRKAEALAESTPLTSTSTIEPESTAEPTEESSVPEATADSPEESPAKKRKANEDVEELEVDINLPQPPSKKELRRLKKGKSIPAAKVDAPSEPEAKKAKVEVEKRSEHGVWIGNMPFFVSKDDLRTFLVEQSDLTEDDITRIHMPGPNDKKSANHVEEKKYGKTVHNKGFAYVDFKTAQGVTHAVELSEQLLSGRRVLIKDNKSFEGRPEKTKEETRKEGKPPSTRVFLGNLSFDTTEESLKEHFEKCGAVANVKVATFEDTGKCKGYAWIVFEELESAEHAVRGFVRVEEEDSQASESDSDDDEAGSDSDAEPKELKPKKMKIRKWWVNKIKGRPLRMEFAEDAQVRYKKRYGKDGSKQRAASGGAQGASEAGGEEVRGEAAPVKAKVVEYRKDYAPRLTGGIVESKGKKVTF